MRDYKLRKKVYNDYATKEDLENAGGGLPDVTASDNGKVLAVVDGEWNKASNSSPKLYRHDVFVSSSLSITTNRIECRCTLYTASSSKIQSVSALKTALGTKKFHLATGFISNTSPSFENVGTIDCIVNDDDILTVHYTPKTGNPTEIGANTNVNISDGITAIF